MKQSQKKKEQYVEGGMDREGGRHGRKDNGCVSNWKEGVTGRKNHWSKPNSPRCMSGQEMVMGNKKIRKMAKIGMKKRKEILVRCSKVLWVGRGWGGGLE